MSAYTLTNISLVLFVTTAFNIVACFISWQRRKARGGLYFAVGMTGVALWTLAVGLDYASIPIPQKVFFAKIEYTGYNTAFAGFALFALFYAGYERWLRTAWVKGLFVVIPLANILLAWTNDWHGWLWSGFVRSDNNTVIFEHGPGYIFALITGYLMLLSIIVSLWQSARSGSEVSRRQARLLFAASLATVFGNLLYLIEPPALKGVDWTPLSASVSGILFLLALYGTRLLDISPIARDKLINSLSDGMIVLDTQNRIIDINQIAADMIQLPLEMLVGKALVEVAPRARSFLEHPPEQELKTELEFGDTDKRYFDLLVSPLQEGRNIIGRLIIFRDITTRKKNELRLLQLTQAVEQSPASVLITDLHGNITYVNPQLTALTGYASSELIGKNPNMMQSGQTPDDVYRGMWNTINSGHTWHGEFLNRKKNGDLYWEDAVIAPVMDKDGQIISYIAVKIDVTQRKYVESALRVSEERFRHLVMSAPDAVLGVDISGNIIFANREAANLHGYGEDELIGRSIEILVPGSLRKNHVEHRADYFANPRTRTMGVGLELAARRKDGSEIPVEINLSSSDTAMGPLVIAYMRDITQRKRAEDALRSANRQLENQLTEIELLQTSLREQAIRDPLTQLHNRRFLNEAIEQEFHHAQRSSEFLSIILLDIDHFKAINDTYGHVTGDAFLVALANLLQQNVRKSDIACRYGGEEFMLVLPATNIEGAIQHAEKLRLLVSNEVLKIDTKEIKITISLGISAFPEHGTSYPEIINNADEALYISKYTGRNRVTVWSKALIPRR